MRRGVPLAVSSPASAIVPALPISLSVLSACSVCETFAPAPISRSTMGMRERLVTKSEIESEPLRAPRTIESWWSPSVGHWESGRITSFVLYVSPKS